MDIQTIQIISFNNHPLNTATLEATIPIDADPQSEANIHSVGIAGTFPKYAGLTLDGRILPVVVHSKDGSGIGSIVEWFPVHKVRQYKLLVKDRLTNTYWYVMAKVKSTPRLKHNVLTVLFYIDDPIYKSEAVNSEAWAITETGDKVELEIAGNEYARPKFRVGPTSPRTGGYGFVRYVAIANRTTLLYNDAINLRDGDFDTAALVTDNKMQSDGDDLRIIYDVSGQEVFRWFGGAGFNTTTTRPIVNVSLPPMINLTLKGAIANSGDVATITVKNVVTNGMAAKAALLLLKAQPYKVIAIDLGDGAKQEIFTYTTVNENTFQITGTIRAQKLSDMKSHSDGAIIRHVVGYWMLYGNSAVEAPSTDDAFKPMYTLANFTNTSRPLAEFYDPANPARLGQFAPKVVRNTGLRSEVYTADHYGFEDVATELGLAIRAYQVGTAWKAPNALLHWEFAHPAGMITVDLSNGEKYRFSNGFPATAALQKSANGGAKYVVVAKEASPPTANTWTAMVTLTGSKSLGGTFRNIALTFGGTVAANIAENYAAIEIPDLTITLNSSNVPLIWFGDENNNNYEEFRITNLTSGHWLEINYPVPVNDAIIIDTENLEAYRESDGSPIPIILDDENRVEWLPLGIDDDEEFVGEAELQYDETGANGLTIDVDWQDRNQ
jgi:hypothetical protein